MEAAWCRSVAQQGAEDEAFYKALSSEAQSMPAPTGWRFHLLEASAVLVSTRHLWAGRLGRFRSAELQSMSHCCCQSCCNRKTGGVVRFTAISAVTA